MIDYRKIIVRGLLLLLAIVALLAAGASDYNDEIVVEMKNNGTYWDLSAEHPDWSETDMIEYYNQHFKRI